MQFRTFGTKNNKVNRKMHRHGMTAIAAVMLAAGIGMANIPESQTLAPVFTDIPSTDSPKTAPVVYDTTEMMLERNLMLYRLVIPDCNIDVAVFNCNTDVMPSSNRQAVADAEDSAVAFSWQSSSYYDLIIGDHARQGFKRVEKAVPGKTLMYLNGSGQTAVYRCIELEIGLGTNTGYDLLDKDGRSLLERHDACIVTYACHGVGSKTPSYAIWEPIGTVANTADAATNFANAQNMIKQEDAKHAAAAAAAISETQKKVQNG